MDDAQHRDDLHALRQRVAELERQMTDAAGYATAARAAELAAAAQLEADGGAPTSALLLALAAARLAAPLPRPPLMVPLTLRRVLERIPPMSSWPTATDNGVAIAWSPDGRTLAVGANGRFDGPSDQVTLRDVATGQVRARLPLDIDPSAMWPDPWYDPSNTNQMDDPSDADLPIYRGSVWLLRWSPDGRTLLIGRADGAILLWDLVSSAPHLRLPGPGSDGPMRGPEGERLEPPVIDAIGWSLDSARLLVTYGDSTARLWDVATGALLRDTDNDDSDIYNAEVPSPDARLLAGGMDGGVIGIWDMATGALCGLIENPRTWNITLAWSPDSTRILCASEPDSAHAAVAASPHIALWDIATSTRTRTFAGTLTKAPWSPDGKRVTTFDDAAIIQIWDVATGARVQCIPVPDQDRHCSLTWSPDSRALLLTHGAEIAIWDVASGERRYRLLERWQFRSSGAWSPDGRWIGAVNQNCVVFTWDVATRQPSRLLTALPKHIRDVAWTATDLRVVHMPDPARSSQIHACDLSGAALGPPIDLPSDMSLLGYGPLWHPDGRLALLPVVMKPTYTRSILAWDIATGATQRVDIDNVISAVSWSPDGERYAVVTRADVQIRATTHALIHRLPAEVPPRSNMHTLLWSRDSTQLAHVWITDSAVAPYRDEVHTKVWDLARASLAHAATCGIPRNLNHLGVHWGPAGLDLLIQDYSLTAAGQSAGKIELILWDLESGTPRWRITEPPFPGERVSWSPDGRQLLIAGQHLSWTFDAATGAVRQILEGNNGIMPIIRWSPDSHQVLTYNQLSSARQAHIWTVTPALLQAELTRRVCEWMSATQFDTDDRIRRHIPDWRGSDAELAAVAADLATYDLLTTREPV